MGRFCQAMAVRSAAKVLAALALVACIASGNPEVQPLDSNAEPSTTGAAAPIVAGDSVEADVLADVAGAKTVADVHRAVEKRVAEALKAKQEEDAAKAAKPATDSKIALEKAKQKTLKAEIQRQEAKKESAEAAKAKVDNLEKESTAREAELKRKLAEEKAKIAAAKRVEAEEALKTSAAQKEKLEMDAKAQPKTEHAARLKEKEGDALRAAAQSKAKSDAMALMKSTAAEMERLKLALAGNEKKLKVEAADAESGLKNPLSKTALEKVVADRAIVKKDEEGETSLKEQLEAALKAAAAARKAVTDGQLSNWGQNPLPTATKAADATSDEPKPSDEEADAGKTAEEMKVINYANMTEEQIQYWLAKDVKYPDSEAQSSEKVMGRVFASKEDEAEQIRTIKALKAAATAKLSPMEEASMQAGIPRVENDTILNPELERQKLARKDPDTEAIPSGQLPSEAEDDEDKQTAMSEEEFNSKIKDINKITKEQIDHAMKVAKGAASMLASEPKTKPTKRPAGTPKEAHEIMQARALKAEAKATEAAPPVPAKPDMGESMDSDDEEEILADRAEEADNLGDSAEGIDEANADVEMDDAAVEDGESGDDGVDDSTGSIQDEGDDNIDNA